jgi:hypothetical protein
MESQGVANNVMTATMKQLMDAPLPALSKLGILAMSQVRAIVQQSVAMGSSAKWNSVTMEIPWDSMDVRETV